MGRHNLTNRVSSDLNGSQRSKRGILKQGGLVIHRRSAANSGDFRRELSHGFTRMNCRRAWSFRWLACLRCRSSPAGVTANFRKAALACL